MTSTGYVSVCCPPPPKKEKKEPVSQQNKLLKKLYCTEFQGILIEPSGVAYYLFFFKLGLASFHAVNTRAWYIFSSR